MATSSCWPAQNPRRITRIPVTSPSHHSGLTGRVTTASVTSMVNSLSAPMVKTTRAILGEPGAETLLSGDAEAGLRDRPVIAARDDHVDARRIV